MFQLINRLGWRLGETGLQVCGSPRWLSSKTSSSRTGDTGFDIHFPGSRHTSDFRIGTLMATLSCARCFMDIAKTSEASVSRL